MAVDVGTKKQGGCPPPPPPKAFRPHPRPERPFPPPPPPPPFMPGPCCPPTNTLVLNNTIIKSVDNALKITEGYVHGSPAYFIEFDSELIKPNIVGEDPIEVKEGVFTEEDGSEHQGFLVTIKDMAGATDSVDGKAGSVPAPKAGEETKFLRGDGKWATIIIPEVEQSDWSEQDSSAPSFIKHKPGVYAGSDAGLVPPGTVGDHEKFLRGDGSWEEAPTELPSSGTAGQVLTKTQNGVAWSDPESASLPIATEFDSVLYTAEPNGEASWVQMEKTVYSSIMTNEDGHNIQDDDTATLWTGLNGKGFGAERAAADENGNNIVATYATKTEVAEVVAKIGSIADGGTLTDGATINVANNAVSRLTTAQSALTLNVNLGLGEIANFAVEITTSVNATTLTVTSTIGNTVTTLHPSVAGGTSLKSNKIYQVTCVGSCWTVAEFDVISA